MTPIVQAYEVPMYEWIRAQLAFLLMLKKENDHAKN